MTALNFDNVTALRTADVGTYAHTGDKYPNIKFRVGKTKRVWTFRGRINGEFKSLVLGTFPGITATQALKQVAKETRHHGNETTADIKTVRAAWHEYRADARANDRASDKYLDDMENKLERHASKLLNMSPTQVSLLDVRRCLNAIESVSTRHHVKAAINSAYSMLDIPTPIQRGKIKLAAVGDRSTLWEDYCRAHPEQDAEDWSPMWNAIQAQKERNVLRGTAWIVMLFTGIRSEDVRSLEWNQVDLQRGELNLVALKSGVDRTIPICDTVVRALMDIRESDSDFVFPATSKTGYLDHLDVLKHNGERVLRQHDTRKHFQEACNEALLPEHVMLFLRGDKGGQGASKMLSKYTRRVGKTAPAMIEEVILERI